MLTTKTTYTMIYDDENICCIITVAVHYFFFCYSSTSPAAGSSSSLQRGWVVLSAERKFSLLSKWKGPGSLSVMVQHHCWEHKALRWIPMGGCEALEGTQPPADKRCQLAAGPAHQLRVHFWLTGHIQRVGSASTQNLSPSERLVSPHIFVFVN